MQRELSEVLGQAVDSASRGWREAQMSAVAEQGEAAVPVSSACQAPGLAVFPDHEDSVEDALADVEP